MMWGGQEKAYKILVEELKRKLAVDGRITLQ
jgi:hypothetical protein